MRAPTLARFARFAVALAFALGHASAVVLPVHAQAADAPRILLVVGPGVSHTMQRDLTTVYADIGTVGADPDYARRARESGFQPTSAEAAAAVLPAYRVDLGIVVEREGLSLRVSHYAGATGALVLQDTLRLDENQLDPTDDFYLRARARRAIEAARSATTTPAWGANAGAAPQGGDASPGQAGASGGVPPAYPPIPGAAPAPDEGVGTTDDTGPGARRGEGEAPPLRVGLCVGFGVAMHATELPSAAGTQRVEEALVPGLDLGLQGEAAATTLRPGLRLDYRTSVGYTQTETPPGGVERSSPARKHELLLDATLRAGGGEHDDAVSFPIAFGFALRDLRAEVEMNIPRYTLAGPHARVLVRVPIADGALVVELGPELQWLLAVSKSLEKRGIARSGAALGVEASLGVPIANGWSARLLYRESHAFLDTAFDPSFLDTQRFVTLGVGASYE